MNRNEDTANLSTDTTSAVVEPGDGADDTARLAAARERARAGNLERGRAKLDAQGKLFVRDRIDLLCDPGTFIEDALLANASARDLPADGVVVVLEDQSIRAHPDEWARKAVLAYHDYGATRLVIEKNQGGEMNRSVLYSAAEILKLPHPNVVLVHAASNTPKELRAQPVSQAYRASHGGEVLTHKVMHGPLVRDSELEAQMASWVPGDKLSVKHGSPDRVDALVWLVQHLLFKQGSGGPIRTTTRTRDRMSSWR